MMDHHVLDDARFARQFEDGTLDPALFSHEAHLRLAWIHIGKFGVDQAVHNICRQIKAFDQKFGDGTRYNVTVTVAAVRAVHHFMQQSTAPTFATFIAENPRLKNNFKDLLGAHYSRDVFNDELARKIYLEPDLVQF